jgi:hypothetical protein
MVNYRLTLPQQKFETVMGEQKPERAASSPPRREIHIVDGAEVRRPVLTNNDVLLQKRAQAIYEPWKKVYSCRLPGQASTLPQHRVLTSHPERLGLYSPQESGVTQVFFARLRKHCGVRRAL